MIFWVPGQIINTLLYHKGSLVEQMQPNDYTVFVLEHGRLVQKFQQINEDGSTTYARILHTPKMI